ncbi:hypothetical protein A607_0643 [Helicobacter pylori UMB_G1]|nr:hypothetical protein A607_0643 [Helicobacter pylori UMB_G1]
MKSKKCFLAFFSQITKANFNQASLIECRNATASRYSTTQKAF